jgi:hypothetical protein
LFLKFGKITLFTKADVIRVPMVCSWLCHFLAQFVESLWFYVQVLDNIFSLHADFTVISMSEIENKIQKIIQSTYFLPWYDGVMANLLKKNMNNNSVCGMQ